MSGPLEPQEPTKEYFYSVCSKETGDFIKRKPYISGEYVFTDVHTTFTNPKEIELIFNYFPQFKSDLYVWVEEIVTVSNVGDFTIEEFQGEYC